MSLSRITLASRRSIHLGELRLSSTYGGLLEGAPSARVSESVIEGRLRAASRAYPGFPVHLIPPERTYPGGTAARGEPVERLPAVACIGFFDSTEIDPANDDGWHYSLLAVVWFQHTANVPVDGNVLPGLRDLPWEQLARDFED
ncbi:MAG: hypothetical protein HOY69_33270 [Streptomyces sp.]|nr:hypothetical protein [Streptomyces sp.]